VTDAEATVAAVTRAARIGGGLSLLLAGVAMLVLPGPGVLTIAGAVSLLSRDLPWARRLRDAAASWWPVAPRLEAAR
jgi:hypothetical protein